jgi:hypothetical protein
VQWRALPQQPPKVLFHLRFQVLVFEFQPITQSFDLFERPRVRDGYGRLIGEDT